MFESPLTFKLKDKENTNLHIEIKWISESECKVALLRDLLRSVKGSGLT